MLSLHFFKEDIKFRLPPLRQTHHWISKVIKKEGFHLKELNFIFCSDPYLHRINLEFLRHDTLTDIITFDNSDSAQTIQGDIFISVDRVRDNAKSLKQPFMHELRRVMIHGVLHLMGYSDKGAKKQKQMRKMEDTSLILYARRRST